MTLDDREFLAWLGSRLRDYRQARNWTQAELATASGLHRTFIGSVERGERNVSLLNLRLLAQILRVPLATLFAEAGTNGAE
jgi:transcriptional regulator with XRE-family HTH domain